MSIPRVDFNDSFANLGGAFQAQQQQSQLAQLLNAEQFKQIQALNDPSTNLALAQKSAAVQAAYPQLNTNVEARGLGEGILKGVSNAIGNAQQVGAYNRHVQATRDIGAAYQQAQAQQRELVMGQIAAQQQRDNATAQYLQGTNPQAAALFPHLDASGRQALLSGIGTQELGLQYDPLKTAANKEVGIQYAPRETVAKELGDQQVRQMRSKELGKIDLNSGQVSSADRERYYQIYGHYPEDAIDSRGRQADLITKEGGAFKTGIDTQTYATEKALSLQASDLGNKLSQIRLQAEPYEVENRLAEAYQRRMINDTKFTQAQQAIQMWDGLLDRMNKGDMPTQGEMAIFSAGIKVLAGQVPELDKAFESAMNLKSGQKPKDSDWNKFFGAGTSVKSPAKAMPNLSIQPKATRGSLVQDPGTGKWHDLNRRDANGLPVEVPAPRY